MILSLTGIVRDASVPAESLPAQIPFVQPISLPRGEDLTIKLKVLRESGAAQNLTGWTVKLGLRKFRRDADDIFAKTATITDAANGLADIVVVSTDTIGLDEFFAYLFDVQGTDGATKRWQLVPSSAFKIAPIVNRPGEA